MKKILLVALLTISIFSAYAQCTPTVSIAYSNDPQLNCYPDPVSFRTTSTNEGTNPTYEWFINGVSQGPNGGRIFTVYQGMNVVNGSGLYVVMKSSDPCYSGPPIKSQTISLFTGKPRMYLNDFSVEACYFDPITNIKLASTSTNSKFCAGSKITFLYSNRIQEGQNGGIDSYTTYDLAINNVDVAYSYPGSLIYTSNILSSTDVITVRARNNQACPTANVVEYSFSLNIVSGISSAGTISSNQTICYNGTISPLTEMTSAAGLVGTPQYSWQKSADGLNAWTTISGETNSTYTPANTFTTDTYFRRVVTDPLGAAPCNIANSNVIHISVKPALTNGTIIGNETTCSGKVPTILSESQSGTGGIQPHTYQWTSATTSDGPYVTIQGATNSSYQPTALTETTYFVREEIAGMCGTTTSNEIIKTVTPNTDVSITLTDPGKSCEDDFLEFISTATNASPSPVYNWYVNNNLVLTGTSTFVNSNLQTLLQTGDVVWVELGTSFACVLGTSPAVSNKVTLDLLACDPFSSLITGDNTVIDGLQNAVYSVTDQAGFSYLWSIIGGTIISGQNTNSVTVNWDAANVSPTARTTSTAYSISVTETNQANKSKTTTLDVVTLTTGVTKSLTQSGIVLFPNPTADAFYIEMPESGLSVSYDILDITGLSVARGTFTSSTGQQKIEANFGAGIYQVILHYNNVVTCGRLSKVQ